MMESFDKAARQYEEFGHIQRDMAAWLAEWIPANRSGRALEIAAGTGFFTRHLVPWNGPFSATDASHAMLLAGHANHPGIPWRLCTADALPPEEMDWIFSSSFLQWADDPAALFAHWRSRLHRKGRILAGLFAEPTLSELRELAPKMTPLTWRTGSVWKQALDDAGFCCLRLEEETRAYHFPSGMDLLRALHRVGAAPRRQLVPVRLRELIREYDSRFAVENGVLSTWTFLRLEAVAG